MTRSVSSESYPRRRTLGNVVTEGRQQIDELPGGLHKMGSVLRNRVARAIKGLLPEAMVQEVQRYRSYKKFERPLYLKIRIVNGLRLENPKRSRAPKTARSFLFVCFGNIMRSPMCEALMNRASAGRPNAQVTVVSAGLNGIPGTAAHPWAVAAAREFGISLEHHRARLLTPEMVDQADVIFAMDYQNQVQLLSRFAGARDKLFMLSAYAGDSYHSVEIHDPYYLGQEETRHCYEILDTCIQNLVGSLADVSQDVSG